jgi:hypothetical protein
LPYDTGNLAVAVKHNLISSTKTSHSMKFALICPRPGLRHKLANPHRRSLAGVDQEKEWAAGNFVALHAFAHCA